MTQIETFQYSSFKVQWVCVNGDPWFRGRDVAWVLGYVNTTQALITHVQEDDKLVLSELLVLGNVVDLENRLTKSTTDNEENPSDLLALGNAVNLENRLTKSSDANAKKSIFINDGGLYALIFGSKKPEAKAFKKWVTSTVLPSIRKTGSYPAPTTELPPPPPPAITSMFNEAGYKDKRSFYMQCEDDLHFKVVEYVRRFYPNAMMNPGLGEFQTTSALRVEGKKKGYQKGTADLVILNKHLEYSGFCVEFKTPKGKGSLSESQDAWLRNLHINGWKVLVSNDYDVIIREIDAYFRKVRLACPHCVSKPVYYKTEDTLKRHILTFHKKAS